MEVKCFHCGTEFSRPRSQVGANVFCSRACRTAFAHRPIKCAGCGLFFERSPINPATIYCSWDCFKSSRWQEVPCEICGAQFKKRQSEIRRSSGKHLCSRACRNVFTSRLLGGDGDWVVGGKHGAARKRGTDWRAAKAFALARDDHACQQCHATSDLEVHHWEPYFISHNNHPDNLVTLCRSCHQDKHAEYRREGFYEDLHRQY